MGLTSRTDLQKDYLISRSMTRFWLGQADTRAGLSEVSQRILLDDWDAWYQHPSYSSVLKGRHQGKMPWALDSDEGFYPDDIGYSEELTQEWKRRYDAFHPMWDRPNNRAPYIRNNDKQTRTWSPEFQANIDAGWDETTEDEGGKALGDGTTGLETLGRWKTIWLRTKVKAVRTTLSI